MRILLSTTALATMLVLGGAAWAQAPGGAQGSAQGGKSQSEQTQDGADGMSSNQTPKSPMQASGMTSDEQVRTRLSAQGFSDIQAITRSGNSYQARAMQNGRPVDLTIDATTGAIRSQAAAR